METIRVNKETLLNVVRKNRNEHRLIFLEALDGYRLAAIKQLDDRLAAANAGKRFNLSFGLIQPEDHTKDYDRTIKMLEMSIEDELKLSEQDFAQYVMDEWRWMHNWLASNALYSSSATSKLGSMQLGDEQ